MILERDKEYIISARARGLAERQGGLASCLLQYAFTVPDQYDPLRHDHHYRRIRVWRSSLISTACPRYPRQP